MMKKNKFTHAQNKPFVMEMQPGRYSWCSCGESKKQPFCDGSHGETGMYPIVEILTEPKTISWCGCKASQNKPFCDGTHQKYLAS
jgi:CDGSH-type Zn-finger protein